MGHTLVIERKLDGRDTNDNSNREIVLAQSIVQGTVFDCTVPNGVMDAGALAFLSPLPATRTSCCLRGCWHPVLSSAPCIGHLCCLLALRSTLSTRLVPRVPLQSADPGSPLAVADACRLCSRTHLGRPL